MTLDLQPADTARTAPGGTSHTCLVVDDDRAYADIAAAFLSEGEARHEKTVAFGPRDSLGQRRLQHLAALTADPYVDFLERGDLEPEHVFAMFRRETAKALDEGYQRLRVVADMDWLLPATQHRDEALRFEVMLDRVVTEVDATVMCAYRRTSYSPDTIIGMLCIHPVTVGEHEPAPFKLIVGDDGCWFLSGEVDASSSFLLVPTLKATASEPWVIDLSRLAFMDVAGMRAIATAALSRNPDRTLHVRGASTGLQRNWGLAGFDRPATSIAFTN
jgi:anti-anti-sigma regulatory factor